MSGAPVGVAAAWFTEVRPYINGRSFEIVSQQRILGWRAERGQMLPIVASGPVRERAFYPSPSAPSAGMAFVEFRTASGERRWWNPAKPERELTDADLRATMQKLRDFRTAAPAHAERGGDWRAGIVVK